MPDETGARDRVLPDAAAREADTTLQGEQLTGLSQAVSYGDDAGLATNYPLVRIRDRRTGHVPLLPHIQPLDDGDRHGETTQYTSFKVPPGWSTAGAGRGRRQRIASEPVEVIVWPFLLHFHVDEEAVDTLIGSLADGPLWVLGPTTGAGRPWGPKIGKEAEAARDSIVSGSETTTARERGRNPARSGRPLRRKDRALHGGTLSIIGH